MVRSNTHITHGLQGNERVALSLSLSLYNDVASGSHKKRSPRCWSSEGRSLNIHPLRHRNMNTS